MRREGGRRGRRGSKWRVMRGRERRRGVEMRGRETGRGRDGIRKYIMSLGVWEDREILDLQVE